MTTDRVAGFIREQPATVPETYHAVRQALRGRGIAAGTVALVGSGSSLNALAAMASAISAAAKAPSRLYGPRLFLEELAAGRIDAGTAIVLSQSGASRTTIAAAEAATGRGLDVVRITAEAGSPFAALGDGTLVMPIGPEPIGPKTKGYTASLAALAALADHLGAGPDRPPSCEAALVALARASAGALVARWPEIDFVLVAAVGPQIGTALEASLKVSEMSGVPAAGFDTEEALHGRLHGLGARSLACFIVGSEEEHDEAVLAARTMRDLGCRTCLVAAMPDGIGFHERLDMAVAGPLDPIQAIVPFQWLAWALARERGLDPAEMRYPGLSGKLSIKTSMAGR